MFLRPLIFQEFSIHQTTVRFLADAQTRLMRDVLRLAEWFTTPINLTNMLKAIIYKSKKNKKWYVKLIAKNGEKVWANPQG